MDTLPYFYYDILSRIVPGAATLAVVWPTRGFPPVDWLLWFVSTGEKEGWEKLAIPVVLLGLCYTIGLAYEVLDYFPDERWFPGVKWISDWIDDRGFRWAALRPPEDQDLKAIVAAKGLRTHRTDLWNLLTYQGGSQPTLAPVFAHCHRFQAEQKMFFHLLYPTLIFEGIALQHWHLDNQWIIGLVAFVLFSFCCRSRDRRKWMQVIAFSKIMKVEKPAEAPPANSPSR